MYTTEYLSTFPFFRELVDSVGLPGLHDSLTGLIARPYMIRFIRDLIARNIPFTLAILDLDNFKNFNDTYGHRTGDGVLTYVSEDLRTFVGERGLVGRYGGDEFLVIFLESVDYDRVHDFMAGMFHSVLRKSISVGGLDLFVTGTVGSASFPNNAADYDSLFALIDKTLYRGKSKGRNCYIIYVKEKHGSLDIQTLARHSLSDTFQLMAESFDNAKTVPQKLRDVFVPMRENLRLYALYYVNGQGRLVSAEDGKILAEGVELDRRETGELYSPGRFAQLQDLSPALYDALHPLLYQAVLMARVRNPSGVYGYLVFCPEPRTMRIWQDDERAAAFFLARMLAGYLDAHGETLI